jgi:hypothetical protein
MVERSYLSLAGAARQPENRCPKRKLSIRHAHHRPQPIAADFMLLCAPARFFFLEMARSAFHPTLHYHF